MYNFENVKGLYEDGYRCIYYDNTENSYNRPKLGIYLVIEI